MRDALRAGRNPTRVDIPPIKITTVKSGLYTDLSTAIYQATGGLPRKINLLAHHTLLAAALTRAKFATADHVQAALPEIA